MEFLIKLLAQLFESFKLKNPLVASIVLLVAASAAYTAGTGDLWGIFTLPDWAAATVQFISLFITAVTGSETFRFLPASKQATARK